MKQLSQYSRFFRPPKRALSSKAFFTRCPIKNKDKIFKESSCIMPISVGQQLDAHEGEKFLATMKLVSSSFKSCTLLIDDSVQRHTLAISQPDKPENFLYSQAVAEGDRWLERNKQFYKRLTIPCIILRWDHWLGSPDFPEQLALIEKLYQGNVYYRESVDSAIEAYLGRIKGHSSIDLAVAFPLCQRYLKEECAAMCLWAAAGYDFELYPTGRNLAMKATYESVIRPSYPDKLISVSLRFKTIHSDPEKSEEVKEMSRVGTKSLSI